MSQETSAPADRSETENTDLTYTVVADGPGYVDPCVVRENIGWFELANVIAHQEFEELASLDETPLEPSGKYHDPETGVAVWVVTKKAGTTHPSEVFGI